MSLSVYSSPLPRSPRISLTSSRSISLTLPVCLTSAVSGLMGVTCLSSAGLLGETCLSLAVSYLMGLIRLSSAVCVLPVVTCLSSAVSDLIGVTRLSVLSCLWSPGFCTVDLVELVMDQLLLLITCRMSFITAHRVGLRAALRYNRCGSLFKQRHSNTRPFTGLGKGRNQTGKSFRTIMKSKEKFSKMIG